MIRLVDTSPQARKIRTVWARLSGSTLVYATTRMRLSVPTTSVNHGTCSCQPKLIPHPAEWQKERDVRKHTKRC